MHKGIKKIEKKINQVNLLFIRSLQDRGHVWGTYLTSHRQLECCPIETTHHPILDQTWKPKHAEGKHLIKLTQFNCN